MTPEERWDVNFDEVRRFRDVHGRWPKESDGALATWCYRQRQAKKGKGHHRISAAQVAKLDEIGFDCGSTMTVEETVEPDPSTRACNRDLPGTGRRTDGSCRA